MVLAGWLMRMWVVAGGRTSGELGHGSELTAPGGFPTLNLGDGAVDCVGSVDASKLSCQLEVAEHAFCKLEVGPALWVDDSDIGRPSKSVADLLACEVVWWWGWRWMRWWLWLGCWLVGWVVDVNVEAKVPEDTSAKVVGGGRVETGSQEDPCCTGADRHPEDAQ